MKEKDRRSKNASVTAAKSRGAEARGGRHEQRLPPAKSAGPAARTGSKTGAGGPSLKPAPRKAERTSAQNSAPLRRLELRTGEKPAETVPLILATAATGGYHLIDSGDGEKLEQYGPYRIVRPEAQALWPKALSASIWEKSRCGLHRRYGRGRDGSLAVPGGCSRRDLADAAPGHGFPRPFTSFRHVGVFPEQLAHWSWMRDQVAGAGRPLKVLNLFGYTGVASLIAAKAGAEVTHVDASKKAIGWARENQAMARAEKLPIRWICDDAMKFIQREERRGSRYDVILTDPPKFGRGPNGEVWQLFDHLAAMLDVCREILSPDARGLVLTAYSIRASFYSIHELMRETMRGRGGRVESGELIIREGGLDGARPGRALSTSLFSRWVPK